MCLEFWVVEEVLSLSWDLDAENGQVCDSAGAGGCMD